MILDKPELEEFSTGAKGVYYDADKSDRKPTREEEELEEDEDRKALEKYRFFISTIIFVLFYGFLFLLYF